MSSVEYFIEPEKYFDVVFNAANEIGAIRIVNPKMVAVTYTKVYS